MFKSGLEKQGAIVEKPHRAKRISLVIICILTLGFVPAGADISGSVPASEPSARSGIDNFFDHLVTSNGVAALSACVVRGDCIVWSGAYGYADMEKGIRATTETVFTLATASKLFTGAALFKLCEEKKIRLDADINRYLPFDVRNPRHPDKSITVRMLLTHTSSIQDRRDVIRKLYGSGDSDISLHDFVKGYFSPSGEYYMSGNFTRSAPGEEYKYSNIGFALLGCLVESVSGEVFEEFCAENIFRPLDMNRTSWFLAGLDVDNVARHYKQSEQGALTPIPHYGWPGYPDGQLRSSAEQVGHYLIMVMNGGSYRDKQVFQTGTIDAMLTRQNLTDLPSLLLPKLDQALPWHVSEFDGRKVFAHSGRGSGVCTCILFDPEAGVGFVLLVTGHMDDKKAFLDAGRALLAQAEAH